MAFAVTRTMKRRLHGLTTAYIKGTWWEETFKVTQLNSDTGGVVTTLATLAQGLRHASAVIGAQAEAEVVTINDTTGVVTLTSPGTTSSATTVYITVKYLKV